MITNNNKEIIKFQKESFISKEIRIEGLIKLDRI